MAAFSPRRPRTALGQRGRRRGRRGGRGGGGGRRRRRARDRSRRVGGRRRNHRRDRRGQRRQQRRRQRRGLLRRSQGRRQLPVRGVAVQLPPVARQGERGQRRRREGRVEEEEVPLVRGNCAGGRGAVSARPGGGRCRGARRATGGRGAAPRGARSPDHKSWSPERSGAESGLGKGAGRGRRAPKRRRGRRELRGSGRGARGPGGAAPAASSTLLGEIALEGASTVPSRREEGRSGAELASAADGAAATQM